MSRTKIALLLGVVAVIAVFGFQLTLKKNSPALAVKENGEGNLASTGETNLPTPATTTRVLAAGEQKLRTQVTYQDPSGETSIAFALIVDSNGIIVDAPTELLATNPIALKRQEAFAAELPAFVKGKKLSELTAIDRVGGSSLTTKAFNDALVTLKAGL